MKKNIPAFFAILCLFSIKSFSQPQIIWQKELSGLGEYYKPRGISTNTKGDFVICGTGYQHFDSAFVANPNDPSVTTVYNERLSWEKGVIKLDPSGNDRWKKGTLCYGLEEMKKIVSWPSGGYVITGNTGEGIGRKEILLRKTNESGTTIWEKTYSEKFESTPAHILITKNGNILLTGSCRKKELSDEQLLVMDLDSTGNVIWEKIYDGNEKQIKKGTDWKGVSALETDSAYIIAGNIDYYDYDDSKKSFYKVGFIALDKKGNLKWAKAIGEEKNGSIDDMRLTKNNEIIATGFAHVKKEDAAISWTAKLNIKGEIIWEQAFDFDDFFPVGIVETDDGFVVCCSSTASNEYGIGLIKFSTGGKLLWSFVLQKDSYLEPCAIVSTDDSGFVILAENFLSENSLKEDTSKRTLTVIKCLNSLSKSIKYYVDLKIKAWEQKGEFEKTEEYKKRIGAESRKLVMQKHIQEAVNYYAEQTIDLKKATLSQYNADQEGFGIFFKEGGLDEWYLVKVPVKDAQSFKENWKTMHFENQEFWLKEDKFTLKKAVLIEDGKEYTFDSDKSSAYFLCTGERAKPEEDLYRGSGDPLKGLNVSKTTTQPIMGKYYALIIGMDNYKGDWNPLNNAVRDAQATEQLLKSKYKFDNVTTLYDEQATRENIINAMLSLVKNATENDNVFIYYSGHGEFNKELNKGYWVPVDAQIVSVARYISNSDLQTFLNGIKAKHTLLVSDACFSGDIFRGSTVKVKMDSPEKYYTEAYNLKSRQAITSGGIEPVMDGGKDGHSVFSYYFLQGLRTNENQYLDASQLFEKLKIPVTNNSNQTPNLQPIKDTGDEGGQFIFIRK